MAYGDAHLLRRLRRREPAAYEELVGQMTPRMVAVARRILPVEAAARDAAQDAFASFCRALPSFEGRSSLATWLHRITVNCALMRRRVRARHPELPIDNLDAFVASASDAPDALLLREEAHATVRRALARLPTRHRAVIELCDIEERDRSQVASDAERQGRRVESATLPGASSASGPARRGCSVGLTRPPGIIT